MDPIEMAKVTYDVAIRIAGAADHAPRQYDAMRALDNARPCPSGVHVASGLMLEVGLYGGLFGLLTPWGRWKMPLSDYFSKECAHALLLEFGAELVPSDDQAYSHGPHGHMGWLFNVHALRRFGDTELPRAESRPGLVSGHALTHRGMLALYPNDYPDYWAKRGEWDSLVKEHDLSPTARAQREQWQRMTAGLATFG